MQKSLIGITTGGRHEYYVNSRHYSAYYSTPVPYVDAVRRAGGVPLLLPPGASDWQRLLPLLDGLIVTGGTDIDPAEYGGNRRHPQLLPADRERDTSELALLRQVLAERSKPLLCICRGLQTLNVAAGGTLHEHIPDVCVDDIHRNATGPWAMQEVQVEPDSLLAAVMGATVPPTASGHHQSGERFGRGFARGGSGSRWHYRSAGNA